MIHHDSHNSYRPMLNMETSAPPGSALKGRKGRNGRSHQRILHGTMGGHEERYGKYGTLTNHLVENIGEYLDSLWLLQQ